MPHPLRSAGFALALALGGAAAATAQAPGPPAGCTASEHRQFDFWLGEWEVTGGPQLDRIVGRNRIVAAANGCALHEHWVSASGGHGMSLNVYEPARGQWTQFWIGADGAVLRLSGGLRGDAMVMEGELPGANGRVQRQRISWTPHPDGSVVQRWETSDDDGASWQASFVGIYRPSASAD
jgi:hypothetical protein